MLVGNALASNLFGPLQNDIMSTTGMSLTQMGLLMSISQAVSFVSFLLVPYVCRRFGSFGMLLVGIFGAAAGFVLMALSKSALMFSIAFLFQSMLSYFYSSANYSVMAECDPERRTTNIPLMHLVYSVASVAGGAFVAWAAGPSWAKGYWVSAGMYLFCLILFILILPTARTNAQLMPQRRIATVSGHNPFQAFSLLKRKEFIFFFIFLICFTSVEYCMMIYPIMYLEVSWLATATLTGTAVTAYWIGCTVARIAVMPVLKKGVDATKLSLWLCGLNALSIFLLTIMPSMTLAIVQMAVMGLTIGALNPVSQIVEIRRWSQDMDQVANLHIISGVVGRLVFPVVISAVGERYGLNWGVDILAVVMAIAVVALVVSEKLYRRTLLSDRPSLG